MEVSFTGMRARGRAPGPGGTGRDRAAWPRPCSAARPYPCAGRPTIEPLKPKQRAHLKSLAHPLKPILHVGKEGVTEATLGTIRDAFNGRELLKVKVLEAAPDSARDTGEALAGRLDGVQLVQVIGRTVVLYRRHPERPEIRLPG